MLSVAEALDRVVENAAPLAAETVALSAAYDRVLAANLAALLTQPPFPSSAMDGYAVRRADISALPVKLKIIGESAAGHPFSGTVGAGQAVRIFTGAPVPEGSNYIVIQENVTASDGFAEIREIGGGPSIRERGVDFSEGEVLLRAGRRLGARDLMLAAQMNHAVIPVRRRPKVAILASGDELIPPGETPRSGQIVSSIPAGLAAILRRAGAEVKPLGIAKDTLASLAAHIAAAKEADVLVTIGGASVGDHDLVREALETAGYAIAFHKIAMRPGKPLMSGAKGGQRVVGLPGNPVSAMICAIIFLLPLIARLLGEDDRAAGPAAMPLACALEANGPRQHYMRGRFAALDGRQAVEPMPSQDSSLTAAFAAADCLIVRPPHAPATVIGETVTILPLPV
jgi:molybdopterin molybdotransferase